MDERTSKMSCCCGNYNSNLNFVCMPSAILFNSLVVINYTGVINIIN